MKGEICLNYIEKIKNCPICSGSGFLRYDGRTYECPNCTELREMHSKFEKSNFPTRFRNMKIRDTKNLELKVKRPKGGKAEEISSHELYYKYTANIDKFFKLGKGLYLFGENESGKTTLVYLIMKFILLNTQYSVYAIGYDQLLTKYENCWKSEDESIIKAEIEAMFKNYDFLVIDDFLYQSENPDWARKLVAKGIKYRERMKKPIIYTSNYSKGQAAQLLANGNDVNGLQIATSIVATILAEFEFVTKMFRIEENERLINNFLKEDC